MIKYSKIFFINIIILIIIFFITEIAISIFKPNHLIRDDELGWKLRPNYKKDKTEKDFYDQTYNVRFEVNSNGIVEVGDKKDKSIIIYNSKITISHIPVRAYKYIVNGKSAIEWVGKPVTINGNEYVYRRINKSLLNIYDKASYEAALKDSTIIPLQIGTLETNEKGQQVFKQIG